MAVSQGVQSLSVHYNCSGKVRYYANKLAIRLGIAEAMWKRWRMQLGHRMPVDST
jgi:hypothetical protein